MRCWVTLTIHEFAASFDLRFLRLLSMAGRRAGGCLRHTVLWVRVQLQRAAGGDEAESTPSLLSLSTLARSLASIMSCTCDDVHRSG
jgi:hypothetical protein